MAYDQMRSSQRQQVLETLKARGLIDEVRQALLYADEVTGYFLRFRRLALEALFRLAKAIPPICAMIGGFGGSLSVKLTRRFWVIAGRTFGICADWLANLQPSRLTTTHS